MGIFPWICIMLIALVDAESNDGCPALFLRYSKDHSYCKPKEPSCNIIKSCVTQEDKAIILKEHNNLRSIIATGKAEKLPPASDMMQMVWDDELAGVAQKHANQCKFEHDCSNCRRVKNFGVGQNLAIETQSPITPDVPSPNWPSAIKSWYDEIQYFTRNAINPFVAPPPRNTYGHFSQLVWAESWRVGCGYVLYTEGNNYKKLYVCNYGPAGNTVKNSMYKEGTTCSACPSNACCDKTCGVGSANYPGLCKITGDRGACKPQEAYLFYWDFQDQPDGIYYVTEQDKWLIHNTLSGNYAGIVLKGGEECSMVFTKTIKPTASSFCYVINYRKGPNVAGQEDANSATEIFTIVPNTFEFKQDLPNFNGDAQQQFSQFSMSLGWNMETKFQITFSVPPGKPDQFLEIQSIYVKDGDC